MFSKSEACRTDSTFGISGRTGFHYMDEREENQNFQIE